MQIQCEIIYLESIMAHSTLLEFCPVFDKNRAKGKLCVCSGVCYASLSLLSTSPNCCRVFWITFSFSNISDFEIKLFSPTPASLLPFWVQNFSRLFFNVNFFTSLHQLFYIRFPT